MRRLWDLIKELAKERGLLNACLDLYRQWTGGEIEIEDPLPPSSFFNYLLRFDYSLWHWTLFVFSTFTVVVVVVTEAGLYILMPLRYLLGTITVLFLPGYALVEALYPRGDVLASLERFALSIGLSLAIVPLVGLVLNYTPFGIRLYPVLASLTVLTCVTAFIGAFRKYRYVNLLAKGVKVEGR